MINGFIRFLFWFIDEERHEDGGERGYREEEGDGYHDGGGQEETGYSH